MKIIELLIILLFLLVGCKDFKDFTNSKEYCDAEADAFSQIIDTLITTDNHLKNLYSQNNYAKLVFILNDTLYNNYESDIRIDKYYGPFINIKLKKRYFQISNLQKSIYEFTTSSIFPKKACQNEIDSLKLLIKSSSNGAKQFSGYWISFSRIRFNLDLSKGIFTYYHYPLNTFGTNIVYLEKNNGKWYITILNICI